LSQEIGKNAFGILCQKFHIYLKMTLQSLLENSDIIFATCILPNYLRDQGIGLSDIASSANVQNNLKIYKTKEEVPTKMIVK
jgi:hypothetical protein